MKFNSLRRGFLRLCVVGLCLSLALMMLPGRFKFFRVRRYWHDYQTLTELNTSEHGFGSYGMVIAHRATIHMDNNPRHLDSIRDDWAVARTQPSPPSTIDSRMLLWNTWGPSCTNSPTGVAVVDVGSSISLPYSVTAVGFGLPLIWWGMCRRIRLLHESRA